MANIKQQKKRNRRSLKQRDTNIRYRSTVRSGMKRLSADVEAGSAESAERAQELVKTIDRASARGAMHKNTAARRKAPRLALGACEPRRDQGGVHAL